MTWTCRRSRGLNLTDEPHDGRSARQHPGAHRPDAGRGLRTFRAGRMSSPEIAKLLEIPVGTIASRLRRAREAFRSVADRMERVMRRRTRDWIQIGCRPATASATSSASCSTRAGTSRCRRRCASRWSARWGWAARRRPGLRCARASRPGPRQGIGDGLDLGGRGRAGRGRRNVGSSRVRASGRAFPPREVAAATAPPPSEPPAAPSSAAASSSASAGTPATAPGAIPAAPTAAAAPAVAPIVHVSPSPIAPMRRLVAVASLPRSLARIGRRRGTVTTLPR